MQFKDYSKYRWFVTSTGKLVIGGKSAEQNEHLIMQLKSSKIDYMVMHTSTPGSPFSIIISTINKITKPDIEQTAIFTACFSRLWKLQKRKAEVHIFTLNQLYKTNSMKTGTFGVKEKIKKILVPLELVLTIQKSKLRAVPESSVKSKKSILFKILPGETDKVSLLPKLQKILPKPFSQEEILQALPSGGIKILK